jgi:hypothetical protein
MCSICGLQVIVFYVSNVLAEPYCETSANLSDICLVACSAGHLVDATFFKVLCEVVVFCFRDLGYCVSAPESYICVCLFVCLNRLVIFLIFALW